ncbi:MAG: hypothetical protein ACLFT2_03615 [Candidatus Brocadiia bacterium]
MAPSNMKIFGCVFVFCLIVSLVSAHAEGDEGLTVEAREADAGTGPLEVTGRHYRVVIRPDAGGRITLLEVRDGAQGDITRWDEKTYGGMLGEFQTAGADYEVVERDEGEDRTVIVLRGEAGALTVVKRFEFLHESPAIQVDVRFENHSSHGQMGHEAPALQMLVHPESNDSRLGRYYCVGDEASARITVAQRAIRELHPEVNGVEHPRWLAVSDSSSRRGAGVLFTDDGPARAGVVKTPEDNLMLRWSYSPLAPHESVETRLLLIPFGRFSALSEVNDRFLADTMVEYDGEDAYEGRFRIMPVEKDLEEVSVVPRLYRRDGTEEQPGEPLVFDRVVAGEVADGEITIEDVPREAGWILYEVYSEGTLAGKFLLRISSDARMPDVDMPSRSEVRRDLLEDDRPGAYEPAERTEEFVLLRPHREGEDSVAEPLSLRLVSGEKETVFLDVRAIEDIESLEMNMGSGEGGQEKEGTPLPASAGYARAVREEDDLAVLDSASETQIDEGEAAGFALTVDTSGLEPGRYSAGIYLEGDNDSLMVPLEVEISPVEVGDLGPFEVWCRPDRLSAQLLRRGQEAGASGFVTGLSGAGKVVELQEAAGGRPLALGQPGRGGLPELEGQGQDDAGRSDLYWVFYDTADTPDAPTLPGSAFAPVLWADWASSFGKESVWAELDADFGFATHLPEDSPEERGGLGEMGISMEDILWRVDLRDLGWREAEAALRRAFWAATWAGMRGVLIHCDVQPDLADEELVLWHMIRDAREEVSVFNATKRDVERLESSADNDTAQAVLRVRVMNELDRILGRAEECAVSVSGRPMGFGRYFTAYSGGEMGIVGQSRFVRRRLVRMLEEIHGQLWKGGP